MNAALEELRAATRDLHADVERTPTMARIARSPADAAAHAAYLLALAVAIRPLALGMQSQPGARMSTHAPDPEDWSLLDEDLRTSGTVMPSLFIPPPASARSTGAAWGRVYVVRGAEAGIAVLDHRAKQSEQGRRLPRRFAERLILRRGEWPMICKGLEALGAQDLHDATATARADFAYALDAIRRLEAASLRAIA